MLCLFYYDIFFVCSIILYHAILCYLNTYARATAGTEGATQPEPSMPLGLPEDTHNFVEIDRERERERERER